MNILPIGAGIDGFEEHNARLFVPDETILARLAPTSNIPGAPLDYGLFIRDIKEDDAWQLCARLVYSAKPVGIRFEIVDSLSIVKYQSVFGSVWLTGDVVVTSKILFLVKSVEPQSRRSGYLIIPV